MGTDNSSARGFAHAPRTLLLVHDRRQLKQVALDRSRLSSGPFDAEDGLNLHLHLQRERGGGGEKGESQQPTFFRGRPTLASNKNKQQC